MATHSSILAWRIPWTEEPGELQSTDNLAYTHRIMHIFNLLIFRDVYSL